MFLKLNDQHRFNMTDHWRTNISLIALLTCLFTCPVAITSQIMSPETPGSTPATCPCTFVSKTELNCSRRNVSLKKMNECNVSSITKLDLRWNLLTTLDWNDFENFTHLEELKLDFNRFLSVPSVPFNILQNLTSLSLVGNFINKIYPSALHQLVKLKHLSLGQNRLRESSSISFPSPNTLQYLHLCKNNLNILLPETFKNLTHLKELNLDTNSISELPNGFFTGLTELQKLDLRSNKLQNVTCETFSHLTNLTQLSLMNNKVSHIPECAFQNLSALTKLDLSGNVIQNVTCGIFSHLTSLTKLSLRNNSISYIPECAFNNLSALTELDLSNNRLSLDSYGAVLQLPSLTYLNLTGNTLIGIEHLAKNKSIFQLTTPRGNYVISYSQDSALNSSNYTCHLKKLTGGDDPHGNLSVLRIEWQMLEHLNITNEEMNSTFKISSSADSCIDLTPHTTISDLRDIFANTTGSRTHTGCTVVDLSNLLDSRLVSITDSVRRANFAQRILNALDFLSKNVILTDNKYKSVADSLAVTVQTVEPENFHGLMLIADPGPDDRFQHREVNVTSNIQAHIDSSVSSIILPPSLNKVLNRTSRILLSVFRTDILFKSLQEENNSLVDNTTEDDVFVTRINSHVMVASVIGQNISDLRDPVIITLVHQNKNSNNPRCVFWDVVENNWSTVGCWVETPFRFRTVCKCSHLTNFALLMDVYKSGDLLPENHHIILSIISYAGCGASVLALILTLVSHGLMLSLRDVHRANVQQRKMRSETPSKMLLNLCTALMMANIIFLAGMQDYVFQSPIACKVVASLLHFFLLAALSWMAVEAVYLYRAIVVIRKRSATNFVLKSSLLGWGVPLVLVSITLSVNKTDNYGLESGVCWLQDTAFYVAFLAPVALILVVNFTVFGLVVRRLMNLPGKKLTKLDSSAINKQLRGAIGVIILLGLTWIFAFFGVGKASIVFSYLFATFNSLQGLFIFLYYCLLNRDIRQIWLVSLHYTRKFDDTSVDTSSNVVIKAGEGLRQVQKTTLTTGDFDTEHALHSRPVLEINHPENTDTTVMTSQTQSSKL